MDLNSVRKNAVGVGLSDEELNRFRAAAEEQIDIPNRYGETTHLYLYYPQGEGPYPVFFNLHGGGFVKGHRDQDVVFCRNICQNAKIMVVDIDYKTAPEKMYPYALHESYDAVKYMHDNAEKYQIDTERMIMCGHSAGGNLTLGTAFLMGKNNDFSLKGIICDYPPTDLAKDPGEKRYADDPTVRPPVPQARMYNEWYCVPERRMESTASPTYASEEELAALPAVLLITAGHDVLSEEAEQLAFRMIEAGTTLVVKRVLGADHGFTVRRKPGFETAEKLIFAFLNQML